MATFVPASSEVPSFKGAVCVIADVCRGNVGQLAADVLTATLEVLFTSTLASFSPADCAKETARFLY
eukprot:3434649-Rhodomonas_salina.1